MQSVSPQPIPSDVAAMLDRIESAQAEFARGKPERFKALWSHTGDVTISGGLGGEIVVGWPNVAARLDWASANYVDGSRSWQRVAGAASGDLAYVVISEVIEARIAGQSERTRQELRVTMVFCRTPDGWRIVHRHADSQIAPQ